MGARSRLILNTAARAPWDQMGTRYVILAIRTLIDPQNPQDLKEVQALQDAITLTQKDAGKFEPPKWDLVSQKEVRGALLVLAEGLPDTKGMFGPQNQVDPIRHLIGSASAWAATLKKMPSISMSSPQRTMARPSIGCM